MNPLQGRHAIVTGGGRGIGRAIAKALVEAGAEVTVIGRNQATLDRVVSEGDAHAAFAADVTDPEAVRSAVQAAISWHGPVDLMIANAGSAVSAPFLKSSPEVFRRMLDINLLGVTNVAHEVLGSMIERRFGRIVAVASTAGLKGYPYVSAYCAAKHAVVGFVRALALETATTGVTVNAVCPGYTDTDLVAVSLDNIVAKTGRTREQALNELVKHNPQQRLISPAEVADAVLWLCGEGARSVTGQAIAVAGGEV
ncbi:SDR family NAD(P)-dependent oxidoreductase [Microvirga makkahensis]|uniref:SDR family NAD(P)-dependent oxidoreductase n=1 Tax=Microvirga makkahensis TaxID=1128670 RepID=A0A7X3MPF9_9HYPH|nr:SDR family NAD(P)-dependent oxidoreductase [Microvirga makkahensis]MXQ10648.1 SDR family NAD(P)-dependent oxidoreductase [Microvirga makkahensis]